VLVEHAGFGGAVAAPIAKNVLEAWFKLPKESGRVQAPQSESTEGD
jgi:cell division protein FtsI/penicillin-binding protein 2